MGDPELNVWREGKRAVRARLHCLGCLCFQTYALFTHTAWRGFAWPSCMHAMLSGSQRMPSLTPLPCAPDPAPCTRSELQTHGAALQASVVMHCRHLWWCAAGFRGDALQAFVVMHCGLSWWCAAGLCGDVLQAFMVMRCRHLWWCAAGICGDALQASVVMCCRHLWSCAAGICGDALQAFVVMRCRHLWSCAAGLCGDALQASVVMRALHPRVDPPRALHWGIRRVHAGARGHACNVLWVQRACNVLCACSGC